MKISKWKKSGRIKKERFYMWLQGFGELADSVITLFSFGFLCSNFEMSICRWRTQKMISGMKKDFVNPGD